MLLAGLAVLASCSGVLAERSKPEFDPPHEVIERSELIVMVELISSELVSMTAIPGLEAQDPNGTTTSKSAGVSWSRRRVGVTNGELFAVRGKVRLLQDAYWGTASKGDLLTVNLTYGHSRDSLSGYLKPSAASPGAGQNNQIIILHLHAAPVHLIGNWTRGYELTTSDGWVRCCDCEMLHDWLQLRMRRYSAFRFIESLMSRVEALRDSEFEWLKDLVFSRDPTYGIVNWSPSARMAIARLQSKLDDPALRAEAIKGWWNSATYSYIDMPVREIGQEAQPASIVASRAEDSITAGSTIDLFRCREYATPFTKPHGETVNGLYLSLESDKSVYEREETPYFRIAVTSCATPHTLWFASTVMDMSHLPIMFAKEDGTPVQPRSDVPIGCPSGNYSLIRLAPWQTMEGQLHLAMWERLQPGKYCLQVVSRRKVYSPKSLYPTSMRPMLRDRDVILWTGTLQSIEVAFEIRE